MASLKLVMIVRNEAHTIARTLESVIPWIDSWCIVDTGSTDGTQAVVREVMVSVPGNLHEAPFVDFATTRNLALSLAGTDCTNLLLMDADDILVGGDSLRFLLAISDGTCFQLRQLHADGSIMIPRVVKAGSGWSYVGAVHEDLVHPTDECTALIGPEIHHFPCEIGLAKTRARWPSDVALLNQALAIDPGDTRARFHLERTIKSLELDA